jgi:hypothetical protein
MSKTRNRPATYVIWLPNSGGANSHIEALNFYPIFIPLDESKVSGVSVRVSEDRGQTTEDPW